MNKRSLTIGLQALVLGLLCSSSSAQARFSGAPKLPPLGRRLVQPVQADLILNNGFIYTVDASRPTAEALAIKNGRLLYVGSDGGAMRFQGPGTELIDLAGRMVMPGIHDSHVHILEAFHEAVTCILPPGRSIPSYLPLIQACSPGPGTNWLLGAGHSIFDMQRFIESGGSPLAILDAAVPNRPAAILEETSHSVWVNSLGLAALGIDSSTPNPQGGVILRDPSTGEPNGVLLDAAGEWAMDVALAPNPVLEQANYDALLVGLGEANRNGITSLADARCYWKRGYVEAWERARDEGTLSVRASVGLWAYPYVLDDDQQIADLTALYSNDPASRLRFNQIKLYSDGEISTTTAALFAPGYAPDPFFFQGTLAGPRGLNYFPEARLTKYVTELEAVGFDMHIHAIGSRGVYEALNAIESARLTHGNNLQPRHRLTHVHLVDPADVPRFQELDVVADFQPFGPGEFNFFYSIYLPFGQIAREGQKLRTLHDAGARVVLSSDYDVGSLSPFVGMQNALSLGAEALANIHQVIRAYTIEPAWLLRQEKQVGSLRAGKRADLIVLDQNLISVPTSALGRTRVLLTLLDGEEVWRDPSF